MEERPAKRRALGSLDANRDLLMRRVSTKRAPISFDKENADTVWEGIAAGLYDVDEVFAYTNQHFRPGATPVQVATPQAAQASLARPAVPGSFGPLEERPVEDFQGEQYDEDMMEGEEDEEEEEEDEEEDEIDEDEEDMPEDQEEGAEDADGEEEVAYFDPTSTGLKEINNLAHFGVSSHKPGNGVAELLSDDLEKYWQ